MLCLKNYFTQQKNKAAIQRPRPLSQRMSLLVARKQSCKGLTLSKRDFLILLSYSLTYGPVKTTVQATHSRRHLVLESSGEILTLRMPTIRKRTTSDARSHKHHHYNGLVSFTPRQYPYTPIAHEKKHDLSERTTWKEWSPYRVPGLKKPWDRDGFTIFRASLKKANHWVFGRILVFS